jgi:quercetin dioxygenase-like cupin family protein
MAHITTTVEYCDPSASWVWRQSASRIGQKTNEAALNGRITVMKTIAFLIAVVAAFVATNAFATDDNSEKRKVSVVFDEPLPNVPGKSLRVVLVQYGPGESSPSHRHPSSAFIYARVLEGAIRSKVNDGPERTYQAGESWTEKPGDHHQVSANASTTKPAKLLAVFVVDSKDHTIVIPDK